MSSVSASELMRPDMVRFLMLRDCFESDLDCDCEAAADDCSWCMSSRDASSKLDNDGEPASASPSCVAVTVAPPVEVDPAAEGFAPLA